MDSGSSPWVMSCPSLVRFGLGGATLRPKQPSENWRRKTARQPVNMKIIPMMMMIMVDGVNTSPAFPLKLSWATMFDGARRTRMSREERIKWFFVCIFRIFYGIFEGLKVCRELFREKRILEGIP